VELLGGGLHFSSEDKVVADLQMATLLFYHYVYIEMSQQNLPYIKMFKK
jgi:hypothetical protein